MLIGTRKGWPNFGPCSIKRWCCIRSLYRPRNSLHAGDLSMRKNPLSLKKKKKKTLKFFLFFFFFSLCWYQQCLLMPSCHFCQQSHALHIRPEMLTSSLENLDRELDLMPLFTLFSFWVSIFLKPKITMEIRKSTQRQIRKILGNPKGLAGMQNIPNFKINHV